MQYLSWRGTTGFYDEKPLETLLQRSRNPNYEEELKKFIQSESEDAENRYGAIRELLHFRGRSADLIPFFDGLVSSEADKKDNRTRDDALFALGSVEGDEGVKKLIIYLNDPISKAPKVEILKALGWSRNPLAIGYLTQGVIENSDESRSFARDLKDIDRVGWEEKAGKAIELLNGDLTKRRANIDSSVILEAVMPADGGAGQVQKVADYFVRCSSGKDDRMMGIIARLIVECEGGSTNLAGELINEAAQSKTVSEEDLKKLRIQVGGESALRVLLQQNLVEDFQRPLKQLDKDTLDTWSSSIRNARLGFLARIIMSIVVFAFGMILLVISAIRIITEGSLTDVKDMIYGTGTPLAVGIGMMLSVVYSGPLKDIRQSVNDVGSANAAFLAYVHRILEISHTFSYFYLKNEITFEQTKQSNELMKDAMRSTIEQLNRREVDASAHHRQSATSGSKGEKGEKQSNPSGPIPSADEGQSPTVN